MDITQKIILLPSSDENAESSIFVGKNVAPLKKAQGLKTLSLMLADREEMASPSEYVRKIRAPRFSV